MRNRLFTAFTIALSVASTNAQAQQATENDYKSKAETIVSEFAQNIRSLNEGKTHNSGKEIKDLSPYFYQIASPGIYYSSAISNQFTLDYTIPADRTAESSTTQGISQRESLVDGVNNALAKAYTNHPSGFNYYDEQINAENIVTPATITKVKEEDLNSIYDNVSEVKDVKDVVGEVDVDLHIEKPNFWNKAGMFKLQFTQNYFSENWYKGGDNNYTLFSNLMLEANYNDQKNVQWDNKLDLRLGFVTTPSDKYHKVLTNNDRINLYSKLGIKAIKNNQAWFWAASFEANTQFMPGYRAYNKDKFSQFVSPLDVFVSLGMDYKPTFKNGNTFSAAFLPLSYKMRYIGSDFEQIHKSYNMMEDGKAISFKQDFGSKVEVNCKLKIAKDFFWRSRFYYFTSYKYAESEFENVFSYQFNKYFSTELNTLWRFDDNRAPQFKDKNLGWFQFKEFFTLGLSYNF